MKKIRVVEKREHYFLCELHERGFCWLVIDEFSEGMSLGEYELNLLDISDRYAHHSNVTVFRLTQPYAQQTGMGVVTLKAGKKNQFVYRRCLQLGGKWQPTLGEWVFSSSVSNEVEALSAIVKSNKISIEVKFKETVQLTEQALTLFGFPLIKSASKKSIYFHSGIKLVSGDVFSYSEGYKMKTTVLANTRLTLRVPEMMISDKAFQEDFFCILMEKKKKTRRKKERFPWEGY